MSSSLFGVAILSNSVSQQKPAAVGGKFGSKKETALTATLTFHPLGNADCTRFDLADGKKMLIDYADMKNRDDARDRRIDLPAELKSDLRSAQRDYYDVVGFTHLDDDHCCGSGDFFWLEHALKYQSEGRIKIRELWVPAARFSRTA
jgi:hypothetical protein